MTSRVARTETIFLGEEVITGKRSDERGRLIDPIARIKIKPADIVWLKRQIKEKEFFNKIKINLKQKGFTDERIKELEKKISAINLGNLNPARAYLGFSKSLCQLPPVIARPLTNLCARYRLVAC